MKKGLEGRGCNAETKVKDLNGLLIVIWTFSLTLALHLHSLSLSAMSITIANSKSAFCPTITQQRPYRWSRYGHCCHLLDVVPVAIGFLLPAVSLM